MKRLNPLIFGALCLSVSLATPAIAADNAAVITPPTQPKAGPGGMDYRFERVTSKVYGQGENQYWIIEPADAWDKPLPVVLFVHGMGLTNFSAYRMWINHLVLKGNIVIYPAYHTGGIVDPTTFTDNTAKAAVKALAQCDGKQHKLADTSRLTMVGHSLGGTIIANLAARPKHFGLPAPDALMLLQPGDTRSDKGLGALFPTITEDHRTIPHGTLMLIVDVENDYFVSPRAGQRIYDSAIQIDIQDKRRLLLRTDDYAQPAIVADHMLPMGWTTDPASQGSVNAYDFAIWRWFDALQASAHGDKRQRTYVFGASALDMGMWSDGTMVRRPIEQIAQ